MNEEIVKNWIKKADNDYKTGNDELMTDNPATDMVCFHMQQCVEKYLKAYLISYNKHFRKTHDIAELTELCKETDAEFETLYKLRADKLNRYGVEVRYPDDFYEPTIEEAKEAVEIAKKVKEFMEKRIK